MFNLHRASQRSGGLGVRPHILPCLLGADGGRPREHAVDGSFSGRMDATVSRRSGSYLRGTSMPHLPPVYLHQTRPRSAVRALDPGAKRRRGSG